jgi:Nif-specific regulatory protein
MKKGWRLSPHKLLAKKKSVNGTGELKRELAELHTLHEIGQALSASLDLEASLNTVMEILSENMGMERGTLTLLYPRTQQIMIRVAKGMAPKEMKRGRYKLGEGITGKVIAAGEPIAVANIGQEPLFLNRTRSRGDLSRQNISFICVPIKLANEMVGAFSVDRLFDEKISLQEDVRLLTTIAAMVGQSVKLRHEVQEAQERLKNENTALRGQLQTRYRIENIIGDSRAIQDVFRMVHQVAPSKATVLLQGESGTGKELIARALHYMSSRSDKPFVRISAASIPETLLESELFGYEKGAFTGANMRKKGRFELADKGTLFLDEVGDLSLSTQVKLLRALQEKEFERVGGIETLKVDARIIAATNRPLQQEVQEKRFREDLFYRLNVVSIYLPPLRERKEDIPELANHFIKRFSEENVRKVERVSQEVMDILMQYPWPGNVRELENCIERSVVMSEGKVIGRKDLPHNIRHKVIPNWVQNHFNGHAVSLSTLFDKRRLTDAVGELETRLIRSALDTCGWNQKRAANSLGITDRIFRYKAKKYKIVSRI